MKSGTRASKLDWDLRLRRSAFESLIKHLYKAKNASDDAIAYVFRILFNWLNGIKPESTIT